MRDAALLLLGHGSTLNADSSTPTYQHAEEIRRRGVFTEVHVGFWKEEPNFRQALRQTSCRTVYVVPNFISSGYFTEQIIPREVGLSGPITRIGKLDVYYCQPVGLSPAMTDVLLKRAHEVVATSDEPCDPKEACLFICGHGTSLNDNSTKIIHEQAAIIRARGLYADCQAVLMEQRPFVKDWRTLTNCPNVIVVPFFISDGLHSYEDIPVLLGLTHDMRERGFTHPHKEGERRLWYANAIGTDDGIADAIVSSVAYFELEHHVPRLETPLNPQGYAQQDLLSLLTQNSMQFRMGQVAVRLAPADFEIAHVQRSHPFSSLRRTKSLSGLRELILRNSDGQFRPLRAAPDLPNDWLMTVEVKTGDIEKVHTILDYIYPAEVANWSLWKEGKLTITPWHETADRQTGRFRIVRELGEDGVRELAAQVCDRGCLKRRLWSPCAQEVAPAPNEIPLLCPEACNYFVSKAREKLKGPEGETE
ncbi:MAG TPA: CbiX/SirB N-terminal domain-containing protein [Candidatus Methylacidiphilales bacterium]|jgi:sirohydrochlorin cobaltochelatase|nr:CbiX/SirB N-terminal domain-containing protein [Candidatus Methylacidiphilales bacterium]